MNHVKIITLLAFALIINGTTFTPAETTNIQETKKVEVANTETTKKDVAEVIVEEEIVYPESYVQKGLEDVKKEFDNMIESYQTENLDGVLNLISDQEDVVFITAGSQVLVGKEEITSAFTKDFETTKNVEITVPWIYITGKGDFAILTAIINADIKLDEGETSINARQTMTFEKEEKGWKIVNSHLSYPAHRAIDEEVVEVEEVEVEAEPEE